WCAPLLMPTPSSRSPRQRVDRPPGCVAAKWRTWKCSIGPAYLGLRAKRFPRKRQPPELSHRYSCPTALTVLESRPPSQIRFSTDADHRSIPMACLSFPRSSQNLDILVDAAIMANLRAKTILNFSRWRLEMICARNYATRRL